MAPLTTAWPFMRWQTSRASFAVNFSCGERSIDFSVSVVLLSEAISRKRRLLQIDG